MTPRAAARAHTALLVVTALLALAALLVLTACQAVPTGQSEAMGQAAPTGQAVPTSLPENVSVSVYQTRSDGPARQVQVQVSNHSSQSLTVSGLSIESARFVESARFIKPGRVPPNSAVVPAGATRDLPVRLPAASCTSATGTELGADPVTDPSTDLGTDLVTFSFTWADGGSGTAEITIGDTDLLEQLTAADCFTAAVTDAVTLTAPSIVAWMPGAHSPATLTIGVEAAGGGSDDRLTIVSIGSTTLLAPVDAAGVPLVAAPVGLHVGASTEPSTIRLRVQPARCDPHAIAEDKKGTILPITVTLDGDAGATGATGAAATGIFSLAVSDEVRVSLYDYVTDWCGAAL